MDHFVKNEIKIHLIKNEMKNHYVKNEIKNHFVKNQEVLHRSPLASATKFTNFPLKSRPWRQMAKKLTVLRQNLQFKIMKMFLIYQLYPK
jgi:hypothetical protein